MVAFIVLIYVLSIVYVVTRDLNKFFKRIYEKPSVMQHIESKEGNKPRPASVDLGNETVRPFDLLKKVSDITKMPYSERRDRRAKQHMLHYFFICEIDSVKRKNFHRGVNMIIDWRNGKRGPK